MKTKPETGRKPTLAGVVACSGFNGTSAQGIVTRMGHDLGHGREVIEPGPVGMSPKIVRSYEKAVPGFVGSWVRLETNLQSLVTRCERAGRDQGGACDAQGTACTVPLGNTGTTDLRGAQWRQ